MSNNTTWAGEEDTTMMRTATALPELYSYNSTFLGTAQYNVTEDLVNTTWSLSTEAIKHTVSTTSPTSTETVPIETVPIETVPIETVPIETVPIETTHIPLTYDFVDVTTERAQTMVREEIAAVTMTTVLPVESTTDVERTQSGIPVDIIWVPYVIFSLVLILLMVVSFVRFHAKNGHKYRRRRAEFWRQLNMQSILDNIPVAGGGTSPPNGGVNIASSSSAPPKHTSDKNKSKPSTAKSRGRKTRRPLVFTSNLNGSMVDVRCGERESLRTFHAKTAPNSHPSNAWSLPQKKSSLFASARPNVEPDDDEVFLLQQTRL